MKLRLPVPILVAALIVGAGGAVSASPGAVESVPLPKQRPQPADTVEPDLDAAAPVPRSRPGAVVAEGSAAPDAPRPREKPASEQAPAPLPGTRPEPPGPIPAARPPAPPPPTPEARPEEGPAGAGPPLPETKPPVPVEVGAGAGAEPAPPPMPATRPPAASQPASPPLPEARPGDATAPVPDEKPQAPKAEPGADTDGRADGNAHHTDGDIDGDTGGEPAPPPAPKPPLFAADAMSPACDAVEEGRVSGRPLKPVEDPAGCVVPEIYAISSAGSERGVELSPEARLNCAIASRLDSFVEEVVEVAAREILESELTGLGIAGSYVCRTRNNRPGGDPSEHGKANAIDIARFTFADGRTISVAENWTDEGETGHFLREVHAKACGPFTTVIGPDGDAYHRDHFHLDLQPRGAGGQTTFCQ